MIIVLAFALTLLLSVLLSGLTKRTAFSTAVIFLAGGFIIGPGALGLISLAPDHPVVHSFIELALFSILFTDGMRIDARSLSAVSHLAGRALLLGMPLTWLGISLVAYFVVGLTWAEAFLVGTVLSPTDPVFASAIIGREEVPKRVRRMLNVESGVNDGIALPIVLAMLAFTQGSAPDPLMWLSEVGAGIAIGFVCAWVAVSVERLSFLSVSGDYQPLMAATIGILVFALSSLVHANLFLAAFTAGVTLSTRGAKFRDASFEFGELIAELLKLASLLLFGAFLSLKLFADASLSHYLFAALAVMVVRPIVMSLALIGSELQFRERVAAVWFGPRGFASVLFAFLVLNSQVPRAEDMFQLISLAIVTSIVVFSSTDVLIARWIGAKHTQVAEKDEPDD